MKHDMESADRAIAKEPDDLTTPDMTLGELAVGFVVLALFIALMAFAFAKLGIDPHPTEDGPLPWMVK